MVELVQEKYYPHHAPNHTHASHALSTGGCARMVRDRKSAARRGHANMGQLRPNLGGYIHSINAYITDIVEEALK